MYEVARLRQPVQLDRSLYGIPLKLDAGKLLLLQKLQYWWSNQQQSQSVKILSHPLDQACTICFLCFVLTKLAQAKKQTNCLVLTDSQSRAQFLLSAATALQSTHLPHHPLEHPPALAHRYQIGSEGSQLVFCTFREFVSHDLLLDNLYAKMVVETGNYVRMVEDGFRDYVTDTYLRRAYLEALRLGEAYRGRGRTGAEDPRDLIVLDSVQARASSRDNKQPKQARQGRQKEVDNNRRIRRSYETKKQQILKDKDEMRDANFRHFQQNQLILLSTIVYVLGFFSATINSKRVKKLHEFFQQFQNKTYLRIDFLQSIQKYYCQVYNNCPIKVYPIMQQTYLYAFCQFINRIMTYRRIFPNEYPELFQVRFEKFPQQKRESVIEESVSCVTVACQPNSKIYLKVIKEKSLSSLVVQNLACPEQYWHRLFRKRNNIIENNINTDVKFFTKIYGVHVSKTPSNQDLDFSEKIKGGDIETLKIKSCGVLLSLLSKFVPDGIVVYFHSQQGLESFSREMEKEEEKIMKEIDNNKKILVESVLEEQNIANYSKFKKCCQIGRGAIFLLSVNSKAAQKLKFYHHLSRCIVFFGLPKREGEAKRQKQIRKQPQTKIQSQLKKQSQMKSEIDQRQPQQQSDTSPQRIAIFNQCLNNCINDIDDYKSVIFVGRQITNDLSTWYKTFIKTWDQTTRQSLPRLQSHFQKMARNYTS